ncbi:piggyBac transposable element-derived protein 4-like isoform X2 [Toxorhynchites rutilus septentrionalis]|uniref:piggyBac transposable element-derived protein 4-like isoform X2 n=1 Tax=Toxorhynchites rutilus septentrionalis TaxID=329112 RepID=UPI0024788E0D|nr:piggyBac transposable element-derived protein 4-like isoform X2 [Toxorhynchites rutilus septentrionalis]
MAEAMSSDNESDDDLEKELEEICGFSPDVSEDGFETDAESFAGNNSDVSIIDILVASDNSDDYDKDSETERNTSEKELCVSGLRNQPNELEETFGLSDNLDTSEDELEDDSEALKSRKSLPVFLDKLSLRKNDHAKDVRMEKNASTNEPQPASSGLQNRKLTTEAASEKCNIDTDTANDDQPDDDCSEMDQSDEEENDWKKTDWPQQPNANNFDNVRLQASDNFPHNTKPSVYFAKFFDDSVIELLVTQTNMYAAQQKSRSWEPVSQDLMKAFLGITILMGLKPLPAVELYWSTDPFFWTEEIAAIMPCKRFKKIMENLHLNDNSAMPSRNSDQFDKLFKVRPLLNLLNSACQNAAKCTSSQSIDEAMIQFKGRSSMKQYMPLKPVKRGYKVWVRADSETGYVFQFDIYSGKRDNKAPTVGLGAQVVKQLTKQLIQNGFQGHFSFDRFFTSYEIVQYLFDHGIHVTATVNCNRSDLPVLIKQHKSQSKMRKHFRRGQYKWRVKKNVAFIMWQDVKMVTLLTTAFHPLTEKATCERTQHDGTTKTLPCPKAIVEYINRMGGVDRFDQKRKSYEVGRKSKKWWMRIFYFCINLAITNAHLLYSSNSRIRNPMLQLQFRLKLARDLVGDYTCRKRSLQAEPKYATKKPKMSSNYQKERVPDNLRLTDVGSHQLEQLPEYRRCRLCSTKTRNKRSKIQCTKCKVTLCATPCFRLFHEEQSLS